MGYGFSFINYHLPKSTEVTLETMRKIFSDPNNKKLQTFENLEENLKKKYIKTIENVFADISSLIDIYKQKDKDHLAIRSRFI